MWAAVRAGEVKEWRASEGNTDKMSSERKTMFALCPRTPFPVLACILLLCVGCSLGR